MNPRSAISTIADREFLLRAWKQISKRNLRSRGLDRVAIKSFKDRLDQNLSDISLELKANNYKFGKLRAHTIKKPGSGKPRLLQIATVRDRVVMKAIGLFIEPAFHKFNLECSFAFIRGRGVTPALKRIRSLVDAGNDFYFEADIVDFFGSVNREYLWTMFSKHIRHKSLLHLLRQCFDLELEDLTSHKTEYQELFFGADSGIPQGGVLSPMLANFYLYEFDRRMTERHFNLVRYADDYVVMCKSENEAQYAYQSSREILATLNLKIHPIGVTGSKSRIGMFSKDGLTFLGIRFEGKVIYPTSKVVDRFKQKVDDVLNPANTASLFKTLQSLAHLIDGWGKCYKAMRVFQIYIDLDKYVKAAVEDYLTHVGIQLSGKDKRKHMKLLGVPSLVKMVEHTNDRN